MKLSKQKQYLYDLYKNGEWRCSSEIKFVRDHRKRISELNAMGYHFESKVCIGMCGVSHSANIHMYRLVGKPKERKQVVEQLPNGSVRVTWMEV